MTIEEYLAKLDAKLQEIAPVIISSSIQREIDINLGMRFIKGRITFADGSILEFSEQLPVGSLPQSCWCIIGSYQTIRG